MPNWSVWTYIARTPMHSRTKNWSRASARSTRWTDRGNNLPSGIRSRKSEELVELFPPYDEITEVFINMKKDYAFNAEKVKRKNCILKIRFAPNATALRVSNLNPFGTNELLYRVFDSRQQGLRFADVGSLDHEYGQRWKHMHEMYKQKVEALKRDMVMEEKKLEAQMEFARHEHEIEQLREQLRKRAQDKARKKADWEMKEHFVIESRERLQQQMSDQRMGFQGNNNFNNRNKFFDMMNQGGGGGGENRNNSFGWEVRNYGHGGRNEMDQQQDQQQQQQQQQFQEGLPDQDRDRNRVLEVHAVKIKLLAEETFRQRIPPGSNDHSVQSSPTPAEPLPTGRWFQIYILSKLLLVRERRTAALMALQQIFVLAFALKRFLFTVSQRPFAGSRPSFEVTRAS
ncbi:no-on-transient A [Culex quinquefasciatus]|uniref:No-on-transient A n=1 Tax=Culex quinquefasciatus TaxID=7176 RepID=B0WQR4_CULQU|nr:no-on-transient A [Culex quinquefasciatus]|eukprot:XP_001851048.1 no-on-transient A [Culex quinquefasciatus]